MSAPQTTRHAAGYRVAGRYALTRMLAAGGMSEVWQADDTRLRRRVAVKCLHPALAADPASLTRFRLEAQHTARLRHTNIAALLDHGRDGESAYLVHELVVGSDLADLMDRDGRLEPANVVGLVAQALAGLGAAHDAGVVHRDIKPANILVSRRSTVKLTDFGISRVVGQDTLTRTGMVMGTAEYLAPELASGGEAGPAADLYAIGVVAYEALAGRRPFDSANPVAVVSSHVSDPVPPLPADVPSEIADVVYRLLAKHPARRAANAAAAAEELREALAASRRPALATLAGARSAAPAHHPDPPHDRAGRTPLETEVAQDG